MKIKILIVDDSVLFRSQIQLALQESPDIEVVGVAANGKIAIEKMSSLRIDLCVLDIEMPELDGIETLREIKKRDIKTKVIMFSSQSKTGANKTLEAMGLGALDFVAKPNAEGNGQSPAERIREALLPKILSLFSGQLKVSNNAIEKKLARLTLETFNPDVLVIASSTGGPNALVDFFSNFQVPVPFPILIAQHMPPLFTASLAEKLGQVSGKKSAEGQHGELLKPDQIYVAPGNFHMKLIGNKHNPQINLSQGDLRNYVRPCADYLFETAAEIYGKNTLGIVLTGMGRDGADGASSVKSRGGLVMIQNPESAVVFGMPGAVYEAGNYDLMATPQDLARRVVSFANVRRGHVA